MKPTTLILLAVAIGLYVVSQSLEARGDAALLAEHGVSGERLKYHLPALVLLLGAFGCFIAAGVTLFWKKRN